MRLPLSDTKLSLSKAQWAILLLLLASLIIYFAAFTPTIRVQDNLDSYFVYYEILAKDTSLAFGSAETPVEQIMGGTPRGTLPSAYNVTFLLFLIFGSYWGYFINMLIVHIVGIIGMYVLLTKWQKGEQYRHINMLISLAFGTLPVFTIWGISVTGQPLLLHAFMCLILRERPLRALLFIGLFPLFSQFVFVGIFILFIGFPALAIYYIHARRFFILPWIGLLLLALSYIIVEHKMFYLIYGADGFVSHRDHSFNPSLNFKGVIGTSILTMLNGWYHSSSITGGLILATALTALVIAWKNKVPYKSLLLALCTWGAMAFIYSLLDWYGLEPVFEKFSFLKSFSFKRFHFFIPLFAYIALAFSLYILLSKLPRFVSYTILMIIIGMNLIMVSNFNRNGMNAELFKWKELNQTGIQYSAYFCEELETISKMRGQTIPKNDRFVCIGVSPSQAQHFGIPTLDSYQNLYHKNIKNLFCAINEREYERNQKECDITNKCYIYSLDYLKKPIIERLDLDYALLLEHKVRWIIASKCINDNGVQLQNKLSENCYLYAIRQPQ